MQPRLLFFITLIVVLLAACSAPAQPTILPTKTSTSTPSPSPEPTLTLTPLPAPPAVTATDMLEPVASPQPAFGYEDIPLKNGETYSLLTFYPDATIQDENSRNIAVIQEALDYIASQEGVIWNYYRQPNEHSSKESEAVYKQMEFNVRKGGFVQARADDYETTGRFMLIAVSEFPDESAFVSYYLNNPNGGRVLEIPMKVAIDMDTFWSLVGSVRFDNPDTKLGQ